MDLSVAILMFALGHALAPPLPLAAKSIKRNKEEIISNVVSELSTPDIVFSPCSLSLLGTFGIEGYPNPFIFMGTIPMSNTIKYVWAFGGYLTVASCNIYKSFMKLLSIFVSGVGADLMLASLYNLGSKWCFVCFFSLIWAKFLTSLIHPTFFLCTPKL